MSNLTNELDKLFTCFDDRFRQSYNSYRKAGQLMRKQGYTVGALNGDFDSVMSAVIPVWEQYYADHCPTATVEKVTDSNPTVETVKIDCYRNLWLNMVAEFEDTILYDTYSITYDAEDNCWDVWRRDTGLHVLCTGDMDNLTAWMGKRIARLNELARLKTVTASTALEVLHTKDYPITTRTALTESVTYPASKAVGSLIDGINRFFSADMLLFPEVVLCWSQAA